MKSNQLSENVQEMDKQALRVYGGMAVAVYLMAFTYCYFTSHFLEMGIVGVVMLGLGVLISNVYFNTSQKSNVKEGKNSFKNAA